MTTKAPDEPDAAVEAAPTLDPIGVNKRRYVYSDQPHYRVYTSASAFELVQAGSAHEAFVKSGVKKAWKIEPEMFYRRLSLVADDITPVDDDAPAYLLDIALPSPDQQQLMDELLLESGDEADALESFEALDLACIHHPPQPEPAPPAQEESPLIAEEASVPPPAEPVVESPSTEALSTPAPEPAAEAPTPPPVTEEPLPEEPLSPDDIDALLAEEDSS